MRAYAIADIEVYINGKLARGMNTRGPRNTDVGVTIQPIAQEAEILFRVGENVIAVAARTQNGPQLVDVGLIALGH